MKLTASSHSCPFSTSSSPTRTLVPFPSMEQAVEEGNVADLRPPWHQLRLTRVDPSRVPTSRLEEKLCNSQHLATLLGKQRPTADHSPSPLNTHRRTQITTDPQNTGDDNIPRRQDPRVQARRSQLPHPRPPLLSMPPIHHFCSSLKPINIATVRQPPTIVRKKRETSLSLSHPAPKLQIRDPKASPLGSLSLDHQRRELIP